MRGRGKEEATGPPTGHVSLAQSAHPAGGAHSVVGLSGLCWGHTLKLQETLGQGLLQAVCVSQGPALHAAGHVCFPGTSFTWSSKPVPPPSSCSPGPHGPTLTSNSRSPETGKQPAAESAGSARSCCCSPCNCLAPSGHLSFPSSFRPPKHPLRCNKTSNNDHQRASRDRCPKPPGRGLGICTVTGIAGRSGSPL